MTRFVPSTYPRFRFNQSRTLHEMRGDELTARFVTLTVWSNMWVGSAWWKFMWPVINLFEREAPNLSLSGGEEWSAVIKHYG